MNYQLAYAIGFHPWEDAAADPPFVAKAAQMFDREERGRQPPYGRGGAVLSLQATIEARPVP